MSSKMRLYNNQAERLYLNAEERRCFHQAALQQEPNIRSFCLTLLYTGIRVSEATSLRFSDIQSVDRILSVRSLKKRDEHHVREIPIPLEMIEHLHQLPKSHTLPVWHTRRKKIGRVTAYRWIKAVMDEANIHGPQACPKGLRHGFGIHAVRCGIQLNMLQKWMGHAHISTTAVYANAIGKEEMEIAERMW